MYVNSVAQAVMAQFITFSFCIYFLSQRRKKAEPLWLRLNAILDKESKRTLP